MLSKATVKIESHVHLLSTVAEAAELEHDLMCMYLYSVFSFKTTTAEGLTVEEMDAVHVGARRFSRGDRGHCMHQGKCGFKKRFLNSSAADKVSC